MHKWIITPAESKWTYEQAVCSVCGLLAYKEKTLIFLYETANNITRPYGQSWLTENDITCDEFIIKKIIE